MNFTTLSDRLRKNYSTFLRDLLPSKIRPKLFEAGIFDWDDMEEVKSERTRKRQAERMLDLLFWSGKENAMDVFVESLQEIQPHLAQLLRDASSGEIVNREYISCYASELF